MLLGDGVIGNTFGFGPNVEGSSPSPPAEIGRAMSIATIVLSAGKGTRMNSHLPKVLHRVLGREIILWSNDSTKSFDNKFFVIGHKHKEVEQYVADGAQTIIQEEQLGTGHALSVVLSDKKFLLKKYEYVLVIPGDVPLIEESTLLQLVDSVKDSNAAIGFVVSNVSDPFGYGRVILDDAKKVIRIVEEKEASEDERKINLINSGIYCFRYDFLTTNIDQLQNRNQQNEFYLTDLIELGAQKKEKIIVEESSEVSIMGINSMDQLHNVEKAAREKIINDHVKKGIYFQDISSVYIDKDVSIGIGSKVLANTHLVGETVIGENCTIGPNTMISDSKIGDGSTIVYSVVSGSETKQEVEVGPYAHLRPGSNLEKNVKVGAFAETKESNIGEGSKVPHLAYVGDSEFGKEVNFSAGAITANYDGSKKSKTKIEDGAFVGSDVMLVAPITVGEGAYIGAGSVITKDVPADALAIERSDQKNIEGYSSKKRKKGKK